MLEEEHCFFRNSSCLTCKNTHILSPLDELQADSPHINMADTSLQTIAYAVAYATFAIGLSTVFLRVYCRRFFLKAWGNDDNIALFVGVGQLKARLRRKT